MIDIRKQYIRMLYPIGRYDKRVKTLINRWTEIGFLENVEELNALKMCVLFELALNKLVEIEKISMSNQAYETAVFPIIRRIVPHINKDIIIDVRTILTYVKNYYPQTVDKLLSEFSYVNNIDYVDEAAVEISNELIKIINNK